MSANGLLPWPRLTIRARDAAPLGQPPSSIVKADDVVTIYGSIGEIMLGEVATIEPELSGDFFSFDGLG